MRWFTSDLHLGHANILKLCDRPWDDVATHDDALLRSVNGLVSPSDELYVLGDFSPCGVRAVRSYRARIACRKVFLVCGNHDRRFSDAGLPSPWSWERDYCELPGRPRLELFHYPIQPPSWKGARAGTIHLHGHIHSLGPSYNEGQRQSGVLRYDVGVDANDYRPVSEDAILSFFGIPSS